MTAFSSELQSTLKEALNALYHHPDPEVQRQAERWLQDFQRSIDAWQVSDSLLHDASSDLESLIFCSQTLKTKVQRDFEELPSEAFRPLRDSLCISVAVASLAVQVSSEDWGGGGILNWLRDEIDSHPEYIPSFLDLLSVLPQEACSYKTAARPERRRQFQKELLSSMETALNLLTYCLRSNELQEQVLDAFSSWLRLGYGVAASTLASHPLVFATLSSLNSEQLSDAAVNATCDLIHYTVSESSGGINAQMPLIQVLVPLVMGLRERFRASLKDLDQDEEEVKSMARLFADMGDSYVDLIATGSDESMMIVNVLLEVASHPDYDITSMTFNFWRSLQDNLTRKESYLSFGTEAAVEAEKNRRLSIFRTPYEMLVSLVSFRVQYPKEYQEMSREDQKDFKQTRYAVADIIMDAASVLGGETTLKILFVKFFEAVGSKGNNESWDWRVAEGALYCIRAISEYVPDYEVDIMPQVMAILPKLPHQPQLLQTACLTIGAYSKWIDATPVALSFLPSIIDILTGGMSTSEESASAAAVAFRNVCAACRDKLCGSLDGLFQIYHRAVSGEGGYKLSTEDSLHLVEALSMVITELPPDHAKKAVEALCLPAVTPLQQLIGQAMDSSQQITARQFTVHIDRLSNIFRYVSHPEAVADAFQRLWPIFKAIFDNRAWDMRTMESLCKASKYAVRTSGRFMGVTIGAMLEAVQDKYQQHHQSCFLYLSSEVIKIFGSDPTCATYLGSLIKALFGHTTHLLRSIKDFTARPDIADDCYLLASRCMRYCPHIIVLSPAFPPLVDCSMIGITVQHREACMSILTFLSDVFDLTNSTAGEQYRSTIDSVVIPRGASLTRILIASLTGALPTSRLEEVTYVLVSLTRTYGAKVLEWAKEAVSFIPSNAITEVESSRFLNALSQAAKGAVLSELLEPLEELSEICRRNRTVQDIVQGALKPLELNFAAVS
ncbi:transportin MOS14 isoform X2 [Amborella trichopoda]|uniref:transportin MOS14 isoform X2 n=1 Tax=Amborella trichopoda TaxID=13333 RepID=UPI0009BD18CA|nr:transportin MOS14 isoform X2 [Amborella trichopoda]|eukprot:XP_020519422.1 transportin MOS14 isoform X2 [Amborella trichopoda]